MPIPNIDLTLIGGPTVLIEVAGARFLTDPTFDPPGVYPLGAVRLEKTQGPALTPDQVGQVDAVLLSHDQHADNFDKAGRAFALKTQVIVTTPAAAYRMGQNALGLESWKSTTVTAANGVRYTITAVPARHGPPGAEKVLGDVAGFVIQGPRGEDLVYVTGDTVFYDQVARVARRFRPQVIIVCAGAAKTRGPFNLTMGNNDVLELAATFPDARIVAVHNTGWTHFTEAPEAVGKVAQTFDLAGRLITLTPGVKTRLSPVMAPAD